MTGHSAGRSEALSAGLTAQERAAVVAWALAKGRRLTTRQVSEMTGLEMRGARHLLYRMSRVIPIVESGWLWMEQPATDKPQQGDSV